MMGKYNDKITQIKICMLRLEVPLLIFRIKVYLTLFITQSESTHKGGSNWKIQQSKLV